MRRIRQIYPGITRAAVEMAYDNGGIHRFRPEATVVRLLARFMDKPELEPWQLQDIDTWLAGLPDDDMLNVIGGEETEMHEFIAANGPPFTNKLLDDIYEPTP